MRVLIAGAAGLLGAAVRRELERVADVRAFDRSGLDVTDQSAVSGAVAAAAPDVVINCAAYNDVDGAEDHAATALEVNAFAVLSLARASQAAGSRFLHYSTDFVFDGTATRPYTEEDVASPRSVYAASKLLGDWFALGQPRAYVLRVESLFGEPGPASRRSGSLGAIVQKIRSGIEVPVFVDRTVSPSYTADVAAATRQVIEREPAPGLYHCVNSGSATWADIATEAARLLGQPLALKPLTLETAGLKARRPRYCALSNARLAAAGIPMPHWKDALARYLGAA
jgi:dTDP-4-dehydrorhamnose reductase